MSAQETEETAVRLATLLAAAMNLAASLANDASLQTTDRSELRSTLFWTSDEMEWLGTVVLSTGGLSWPPDARDRIERLRMCAGAWDPVTSPPPEVLDAANRCLQILGAGPPTP